MAISFNMMVILNIKTVLKRSVSFNWYKVPYIVFMVTLPAIMNMGKQVWALIKKDLLLDWRQQFSLASVILYMAATIFIVVMATQSENAALWNALLWIIILFVSNSAVAKNFSQDSDRQRLYYYSICNPIAVLIAKYLYNALILAILSVMAYLGLRIFTGIDPVRDHGLFCIILLLASIGFSTIFTFTSSIALVSNNRHTLLAILSFPVIIPMLLLLIKLSQHSMGINFDTSYMTDIFMLLAIDMLLIGVSFLLFPFLWKD